MNPRFPVRACLLGASLLLATLARAADIDFAGGLSGEERDAVGIGHLSASEAAVLNGLVGQDVTLAHDGGVTGFSSGFCERHWDRERLSAGLVRLSATERAALDRYAARAIALGPPPDAPFTYAPPRTTVAPIASAPKPAAPNPIVSTLEHMEVHGDVSFTVGGGSHGSSFYGTSMDVYATDPSGRFTVGVGVSDYHGKGLLALCAPDPAYSPFALLGPPYGPYYGPYGPALGTPGNPDW
jgi:hypothetical protein